MVKDNREKDLLEEAKSNFAAAQSYFQDNYEEAKSDQEFVNGINQWDSKDKRLREIDGRPSLVLNQMLPYCNQVINDIRQARPSIRVTPEDGNADVDTASMLAGRIRKIERDSNANDAYDTAAMNAVTGGLGWIRVCVDYANEFTFDQEIRIERVLKFSAAYLDPAAMRLDGTDAEFGFIFDDVNKDKFKEEYPDAIIVDSDDLGDGWVTENTIRVAEYYYKSYEKRVIYKISYEQQRMDGVATFVGVVAKEELDVLDEQGIVYEILEERETRICKVKQCTFTGCEILSESVWPSKYIPLVPVYGQEVYLDNRRQFFSLIKQAKDPQRMYNYHKSASTEFIALQPKAPWVGPLGSFKSNPDDWQDANRTNVAFLEYDVVYDEGGRALPAPTRTPPIQGSPAMVQEAEGAKADIRLALGMGASNMGLQDNAISGIAIRNRQIEGDNATFHFMDNLASAITQVGCILVDLIPKVYAGPHLGQILNQDGTDETIPINQPFKRGENGLEPTSDKDYDGFYDFSKGKYGVVCDVGPSYSSQRQETADKMLEAMSARPELFNVMGDLFFKALDMPMAQEISDRIKATMDPVVLGDDPEVARLQAASAQIKQLEEQLQTLDAALRSKQEDQQFEQTYKIQELQLKREELAIQAQKASAEIAKMQSESVENRADAERALADASKAQAETAQVITELQDDIASITEAVGIMFDDIELNRRGSGPEPEQSIDIIVEENDNDD